MPPDVSLPGREILPHELRATAVHTQKSVHPRRQCRLSIFRRRPRFCCDVRPELAATVCVRSSYKARTTTPAELQSERLRAVIPLVVAVSDPCGAESRSRK